jgi:hypothetical protein
VRTLLALALLLSGRADGAAVEPAYLVALSHGADAERDWRLSFFEITGDGLLQGRNNAVALALERPPTTLVADWPRGLVYFVERPARGVSRLVAYAVDPSGFPFVFGKADLAGAPADAAVLHENGAFLYTSGVGGDACYALEVTSVLAVTLAACPPRPAPGGLQWPRLGPYAYDWVPGVLRVRRFGDGDGAAKLLHETQFPRDRTVVSLVLLRPP